MLALMLPASGCGSEVNAIIKDCLFDFPILPTAEEIDIMSNELAMKIDEHDANYETNCKE